MGICQTSLGHLSYKIDEKMYLLDKNGEINHEVGVGIDNLTGTMDDFVVDAEIKLEGMKREGSSKFTPLNP